MAFLGDARFKEGAFVLEVFVLFYSHSIVWLVQVKTQVFDSFQMLGFLFDQGLVLLDKGIMILFKIKVLLDLPGHVLLHFLCVGSGIDNILSEFLDTSLLGHF